MTTYVVDASVVAKWFFPEDHSAESRRLLSARYTLLAPDLIWPEVGNVVWKRVRRGELEASEAPPLIADLVRMPLSVTPTKELLPLAYEVAAAVDRTVYDAMYLALAIHRQCKLMTADERFINAVASSPFGKHVRHVARRR